MTRKLAIAASLLLLLAPNSYARSVFDPSNNVPLDAYCRGISGQARALFGIVSALASSYHTTYGDVIAHNPATLAHVSMSNIDVGDAVGVMSMLYYWDERTNMLSDQEKQNTYVSAVNMRCLNRTLDPTK